MYVYHRHYAFEIKANFNKYLLIIFELRFKSECVLISFEVNIDLFYYNCNKYNE